MYYFVSDIHLGLDKGQPSREREKLLVGWLDKVAADAEAIAIVGDLFDFRFEWRRVVPKGYVRLLGKLAELTDRGIRIHFFTGNHDMWLYDYLAEECGVVIHRRPEVFEAYGKKIFVAHGDNLYLRGEKPLGVRIKNYFFYSRFWRRFLETVVHPDLTMLIGARWSAKHRNNNTHTFAGEDEYLVKYAREYARCVDVDYFIFGHLHTPVEYPMSPTQRILILGDWLAKPNCITLAPTGKISLKIF